MSKKVFCNGCYDVLTPAHRALLKYAKSLGDILVVAINSDRFVKELKGQYRPIFNQRERAEHLNELEYVDQVYLFDSKEQLEDTIQLVKPDILVIGAEYRGKEIVGDYLVPEIRYFDTMQGYSSTNTIKNLNYPQDENEQWRYM